MRSTVRSISLLSDGGWRGWAIIIAQQMAGWGYDVYGLDTKTYLSGLTGDAFVSFDEAKRLATAAREPKRIAVIQASNHRFDGNINEFYRQLREGLEWLK